MAGERFRTIFRALRFTDKKDISNYKHTCCVCHEVIGTLSLDNNLWECEDCAQYMSDLECDFGF